MPKKCNASGLPPTSTRILSWLCKIQPFTLRAVGVLVVHVAAGVVVFAAAGVGPKTTPVKVILEIATGGRRALWARANVLELSAEGEAPASVGLSLSEVGSVGAGTGKLGVQFGVQLLPAGSTLDGEPFFRKEFSRGGVMVP